MTATPAPPPGWAEAALQAGTELGLGNAFAAMDPADWDRVCRRTGQILAGQGQALPPGWERAVARLLRGADAGLPADDALARDTADAVLAEKGEVFAPEDDA
ncbi:hypothetical protein MKK75_31575 [Methylobacterium sp. J-030]|uniref:hypothetical protein n=1 Tax=Methylobacterium sp. J-030 TaxID=2836627 RepID=UPI001FB89306|nr:hypothetical protein [Methylobacterium sp. J-030]MCJ2073275.1 hypothetical protein [Methylobacterium sp. J-030]